jgi:hypothetical protein
MCNYSRTCQHFMRPEGSLQRSQEPSTGPCPQPDHSSPHHLIPSLQDPYNIIHPPTSWSSWWSFPSGFPTISLYAFLFSPFHTAFPAHTLPLHLTILSILGEEYKFRGPSLDSFATTPHFISPCTKYSPHHLHTHTEPRVKL